MRLTYQGAEYAEKTLFLLVWQLIDHSNTFAESVMINTFLQTEKRNANI